MSILTKFAALAFSAFAVLASPVMAEEVYDSPSGSVRMAELDGQKAVAVGGELLPLGTFSRAYFHARVRDYFLIQYSTGGSACPVEWVWLNTAPGSVGLSESFGCSEWAEVDFDGKIMTVTMESLNSSEGEVAYDFDGHSITRRVVGLKSNEVAQAAGDDLNAWVGEYAYYYVNAPENEDKLIKALGWNDLDQVRRSITVSSTPFEVDGDWIVGRGCRPHSCDSHRAAFAIHRSTGSYLVALMENKKSRLIGEPIGPLPTHVRAVMTGN